MGQGEYGVSAEKSSGEVEAPELDYLPPKPRRRDTAIGLIGAGNIASFHLEAYKRMGLNVVAICDRNLGKAEAHRDACFPGCKVYADSADFLADRDIEVVDIATHPEGRVKLIEQALGAGKHVLSQKPFVTELEDGERLVRLAKSVDRKLAVNHNGRWAPHFSVISRAIEQGMLGELRSIDFTLQWDQTWIAGNESFERMRHMVLYDFAIHWFDIASCWMGSREAESVFASIKRFPDQKYRPAALAQAVIDYRDAQVRMCFNAHNVFGEEDCTTVAGSLGLARARGPRLTEQSVTIYNRDGYFIPRLEGDWFKNGFEGAMGELLLAIEEGREPANSGESALRGLRLCCAALKSADSGMPQALNGGRQSGPAEKGA